jgi:hypothetical protein
MRDREKRTEIDTKRESKAKKNQMGILSEKVDSRASTPMVERTTLAGMIATKN